jgi:hypothetical protein
VRTAARAAAIASALVVSGGLVACNGDGGTGQDDVIPSPAVDPADRDGTGGEIDPGTDEVSPTPSS